MNPLEQKIDTDFKNAFKQKSEPRLGVLKMLRAALKNASIAKREALSDDEILAVLAQEAKRRRDAAALYRREADVARAESEEAELAILSEYLPAQLSSEEIEKIVREKASLLGASGPGAVGKVMGAIMKELKGRADGQAVKEVVIKVLTAK